MNFKNLQIFLIITGLTLTGCKKTVSESNSDIASINNIDTTILSNGENNEGVLPEDLESNNNVTQYNIEVNKKASFMIVDVNGNPLKYNDETNYSELPNLIQAFYAGSLFYNLINYYEDISHKKAAIKDGQNYLKGYSQEYIDFFNSKVKFLSDLPLESEDEELNEVFNKIYYDFKDSNIYEGDRGYGYQKFLLVKNGRTINNKTFRRNDENKNLEFK